MLNSYFPRNILDHIAACHPPREELGSDMCAWKLNRNGKFTVQSTYKSIFQEDLLNRSDG